MDLRGFEVELSTLSIGQLNALDADQFVARLGQVFEHSPWVPRSAYGSRPFASLATLHATMVAVVDNADPDQQLALLRAHPELARRGPLTAASASEQGSKGLDRLDADEAALFDALNSTYRARFGFPFIIAVRGQRDRGTILAALSQRVVHTQDQERSAALAEVAKIARFRLEDLIAHDV
jgi:2-oxo-4-hydroxy-4-carboxy-5-ureidoimidazoline decarboxylase